jgi:thiol:disulfide interchange protein DsbD
MDASRLRVLLATASFATALVPASAAIGGAVGGAEAKTGHDELVRAELVANVLSITPGEPFRLAVRLHIADTWHVNWINPGDAGLAPSVAWNLPDGFRAGPVEWPYPGRYDAGPFVVFGYDREVLLVSRVAVPAGVRPGTTVEVSASVDWLACQEACIPGDTTLSLRLPVEAVARADEALDAEFAGTERLVPAAASGWSLSASYGPDQIAIEMHPMDPAPFFPSGVFFFPTESGVIENADAQELRPAGRGFELLVHRSRSVGALPQRLAGVLVSENGWHPGGSTRALQIEVPLEPR